MEITLDIPNTASPARRESRYYREALVAMLYQAGDLSSQEGCQVLAISRREFEQLLAHFRVSIMPDDEESVAAELDT